MTGSTTSSTCRRDCISTNQQRGLSKVRLQGRSYLILGASATGLDWLERLIDRYLRLPQLLLYIFRVHIADQESMLISRPLPVRVASWTMTTSWDYVHRAIAAELRSCDACRHPRPIPLLPVNGAPGQKSQERVCSVNDFGQVARRRRWTTSKTCPGRVRQHSNSLCRG
jgi:hypothetical protein